MLVVNRIIYNCIESNLVYPDWTNKEKYKVLGILDKEYVQDSIKRMFNADYINNKYAIFMNDGLLWYQHDNKTFILQPLQ